MPSAHSSVPGIPTHPALERRWYGSYPPGVPTSIELDRYSSLCDVFSRSFKEHADKPALICMGVTVSYRQLDEASHRLAAWLQSLGLAAGARVAVMLPSLPQYLVCVPAILRAGFVVVNVNPMYTPRELAHQLKDSGAEAIVILENFAHVFQQVREQTEVKHVVVATVGDMLGGLKGVLTNFVVRKVKKAVPAWSLPGHDRFNDVLQRGASLPLHEAQPGQGDLAMLQYTGGTTGVAKGAMLLHRSLLAAVSQAESWMRPALTETPAVANPLLLVPLPLYHVYTLYLSMMSLSIGACCLLIPNPRDINSLVKAMQQHRFHLMTGLNTLYNALLNHPQIGAVDFSACRSFIGGGAATQQAIAERWHSLTGRWIQEGWGMSETTGAGTCNPPHRHEFNGSIGLPLPSTDMLIRDEEGHDLPISEVGEICIAGPQLMAGYWQRAEETEQALGADGFLKTGDIGMMDEQGYVRIVDRKKDMILVSGFNVYPSEIEEVAIAHPGVLEAAAISMPDEHSGEAVKLFVVKKDPQLSVESMRSYCEKNLTNYKRPRQILFIDELPKSPVGKVLRRALRDS
ncbi:AMP-binding protein [Dyella silvatica]|uniref:AMP-binding protein n=1 Tax=Dyella silvatica TaxID=2992128 RepID=UPI002252D057|nr:AMP-binding protein [Dyella silvatica]